ncbi:MAG TPA: efflux transporter outer membrane subunit [Gammaproteobacteria bacterium]|nr:efflux transporter outer membrane subunit [Gammaproteobacteria bacterium]
MSFSKFASKSNAAWAVMILTAGCSVGPNYKPPVTAVPASWNEAQQSAFATGLAPLTDWWTEFNDPLLNMLVERAVQSNLDLRLAEARIRESRALRSVTASDAWPQLDAAGTYARSRSSENAISRGGGESSSFGANGARDLFRAGFDASWEIDIFGGVRRRVEAADANVAAAVEERRNALVTLLGDVARNYIELRGFQRRLTVARSNLHAQQETLDLTRVRFEAGLSSDFEVAQAEGQVNTTAAQIPALESAFKGSVHRLDVLLGQQPGTLGAELSNEAPVPALPPQAHVGLPAELLRRRPDIRRAERVLAAATAQVGAATADLFPRFSLTGAFGFQSIHAGDLVSSPSRFWSIGPTILWPVFDAGRIRANIAVRDAQQEQALTLYEKTVLTAFEDVENSLVNYAKEQIRYRALIDAVAANRRAVQMANELYTRGLIDFLNVLETQRSLYASESELAQSETIMASNLVALYKAFGGGWETD